MSKIKKLELTNEEWATLDLPTCFASVAFCGQLLGV